MAAADVVLLAPYGDLEAMLVRRLMV